MMVQLLIQVGSRCARREPGGAARPPAVEAISFWWMQMGAA
jgi:hypothetical protein